MDPIKLFALLCSHMVRGLVLTLIFKFLTKIFLPSPIPDSRLFIICLSYSLLFGGPAKNPLKFDPSKHPPSNSEPSSCFHPQPEDGLTELRKELDKVEDLLHAYGSLISQSGIVCRDTFKQIYKEQKEQLRQYNDFRKQYADQFGSIVNVLEGHRKDIAENSRVAKEQNTSLCNIIGQYRQIVEDNQKFVREHIDSVTKTLKAQDEAITRNQDLVNERDGSIQNTLKNQSNLIEDNAKLIREHGTSIDSVVSDHANLVGEYQKALDGLALLITANRIFSSIHEPSDWENLGDHTRQVDAKDCFIEGTQEHEKPINGPDSAVASANVVDNVQEIARVFRAGQNAITKAIHGKPDGRGQRAWLPSQGNNITKVKYPGWEPVSGMEQLMATVFDQLKTTLQNTVEARHAEEMRQLRQGREDMERLRAELGDIQELRQHVRESQARREIMAQQEEEIRELKEEIERLRGEMSQDVRDRVDQRLAEFDKARIAFRDGHTATTATMTDPTDPSEVTLPGTFPTAAPTANDDAGAVGASGQDAEAAVDDGDDDDGTGDEGDGRLLGDFLGRLMAREDWPDKKKTRRKTRKMYAMARQRAEQQREE